MKFINDEARKASNVIASKRGSFPNFDRSSWAKDKRTLKGTRNATVTTIAPTGTISIIADATSGIEPLFAVAFVRNVMEDAHLLEVNPTFEELAKKRGFYSKQLMLKIAKEGSIQGMKEVPKDVQRLFLTALDLKPEAHIRMQAAFQKFCDNAVSKTVNLAEDAPLEEVKKAYLLAFKLKCKGVTVYRYGSRPHQVLVIGEHLAATDEFAGGCPGVECSY
jgi:ribonucleoside-diphosphate reductase alpha chain